MADFNDFWGKLIKGLEDLAREDLAEFQRAAVKDGRTFLNKTKEDLQHWTALMARGELKHEYFEWLVRGKKELAEMVNLEQAGLPLERVDEFRNALISLVIYTASGTFL